VPAEGRTRHLAGINELAGRYADTVIED